MISDIKVNDYTTEKILKSGYIFKTLLFVWSLWWYGVEFEFWNLLLAVCCFADSMVGPDCVVLHPWFLLKVRYDRILDTLVCLGALIWLFSPACDAVNLTLKVGFICPFVVDDPTYLGATIVVAQALCCPSSTYPLRRKPAFLPMVIKLTCLSEGSLKEGFWFNTEKTTAGDSCVVSSCSQSRWSAGSLVGQCLVALYH